MRIVFNKDYEEVNELFVNVLKKYETSTGHYRTARSVLMEHEDSGECGCFSIALDEELDNVISTCCEAFGEVTLIGGCSAYEITPDGKYISLSLGYALVKNGEPYSQAVYYQVHDFLPLAPCEIEK